jgi:malonyl-CoA O-methyltransferase
LPGTRTATEEQQAMATTTGEAPEGFSKAAGSYDDAVRHNVAGSERLVMSLPPGDYATVLDVGCGTGFTSEAMLRRFDVRTLVGVDPAEGMLEVFATKLGAFPGVRVELRAEDVMAMGVDDGAFDAVICAMALHWFPDKPGAVARMGRAVRPGGVVGILTAGRGGEEAWRGLLEEMGAPPEWTGWFAENQRDVDETAADLRAAGLEPLDVWMERRRRTTPPEAFMARTRAVAGHLLGNPPGGFSELDRRIEAALHAASGPDGFVYDYCKLFAVARRPGSARAAGG